MRKKLPILLLVCAMLSVFICGCAPKTEKPVEYIGIISAMDNEIDLYSRRRRSTAWIP